ncbi:hypothetical protein [Nonomuraea sp. NPDC049758]|uniref:hypothetical protein n=1 Tax=Nonomuraea sp. NPDC049758 TaxID=3154360 RepID=UPI003422BB39
MGTLGVRALEEIVALLRRGQLAVRRLLTGWDVHAAIRPGALRPWPVSPPRTSGSTAATRGSAVP